MFLFHRTKALSHENKLKSLQTQAKDLHTSVTQSKIGNIEASRVLAEDTAKLTTLQAKLQPLIS